MQQYDSHHHDQPDLHGNDHNWVRLTRSMIIRFFEMEIAVSEDRVNFGSAISGGIAEVEEYYRGE
ncbi:hypothetical protein AYJ57_25025 (plasmid) [Salipiger sp. CCB-MM3]|uniref:hypothetical protein n=1 Tax=Salipiger sp. CCB-MM3 TaxID=1792508 RepID=UPI00080AAAAA|nr:hypothetical protein [Salipiger sp. CCB-MM3]ANT63738.1 hypothetical protein AYJ57_25025 [Salipiger sp. CCB-MM3]